MIRDRFGWDAVGYGSVVLGPSRSVPDEFRELAEKDTKAGNLNNRHVEILCAASARVNVSVFYQPLTPPTGLGLLTWLRGGVPGRAARGSTPER
jgi:hypothetical protein